MDNAQTDVMCTNSARMHEIVQRPLLPTNLDFEESFLSTEANQNKTRDQRRTIQTLC